MTFIASVLCHQPERFAANAFCLQLAPSVWAFVKAIAQRTRTFQIHPAARSFYLRVSQQTFFVCHLPLRWRKNFIHTLPNGRLVYSIVLKMLATGRL